MIHALHAKGTVEEAIGYVAEVVDKKSPKILVLHVTEDGHIDGHGFGETSIVDINLFATFLQKRVMDALDA